MFINLDRKAAAVEVLNIVCIELLRSQATCRNELAKPRNLVERDKPHKGGITSSLHYFSS